MVSTNMFMKIMHIHYLDNILGRLKYSQTHLGEDSLGDSGLDLSYSSFKILEIFLPTSSFKFSLSIDFS